MNGRSSYELGVAQERLRIGRDLHDNIGARLLKLIHHLRGTPDAEIARDAMKDLRTSIAAMDSQPVPLRDALADWRAEASSRCEVGRCQLTWDQNESVPSLELLPRVKGMLESVMREIFTNALKHASPNKIGVAITSSEANLTASVTNDGEIADPLTWKDGYGLRNIRGRMEELGGNLNIVSSNDSVTLILSVPLA
jgi:signal transduction histidine kinase